MNDHTHPGDAAHLEVQKAVTSLKERTANTQDSTGQVVAAAVANLLTGCFDFVAVYIPCQLCCKYDCMLNRRPICAFELLIP